MHQMQQHIKSTGISIATDFSIPSSASTTADSTHVGAGVRRSVPRPRVTGGPGPGAARGLETDDEV